MSLRFGKEQRGPHRALVPKGWGGLERDLEHGHYLLVLLGEFLYSMGPPHLVRDSIHSS